jgi:enamidase
MPKVLIHNIGELFTGDLAEPKSTARAIAVNHGKIECLDPSPASDYDTILDANGAAVLPGLVDGHVHPVVGEWTPTQNASGWVSNYLHGGSTTLVSAGELHMPGLDPATLTPEIVTSLAVTTASMSRGNYYSGVKLHSGCALMVPGLQESHFERLAQAGSRIIKFLFYPLEANRPETLQYLQWARARGLRAKVHTGGMSRSGASQICGFETLNWMRPDIAAHVSGGPIPMSDVDQDAVVDRTDLILEVCSSGSYGSTVRLVRRLAERGQLDRLTLGTDTPGGTGVIPRGMLRNILLLTSVCGLSPEQAIAVATGNTARAHGLDVGVLAPGRPADLIIAAPVEGSAGSTLSDAIAHGDLPGIAYVMIDGQFVVSGRSQQTPPPRIRPLLMNCCPPC